MASTQTQSRSRTKPCTHFWRVSPPQGELSWGECSKCGKRKRFSNRFEGRDRSNNSDLFTEGRGGFRPDRRATYYEPAIRDAFEEAAPSNN